MSIYMPIDEQPGDGLGGSSNYPDPNSLGGSSPITVVDATHFDIRVPNTNLLAGIRAGTAYTGTASMSNVGASSSYRWAFGAFGGDQGYPQCVAYHQQRRVYASTNGMPQSVWMSRIGSYPDFGVSSPVQDDDAVRFTLNSGQLNAIRGMLSLRKLLLLTSDNEWIVGSGNNAAITPSAIQVDIQGYRGSSKLIPIGVGNVALYVQSKGQIIRDIGYEFASDSYSGNDLTVMASHLLQGKSIVDWAFQQAPFSCVWSVRNDGVLLGASYMREQQVIGWHRHDTDGMFESVCVIPEGNEDVPYFAVTRLVNGENRTFIERMQTRYFSDTRDAFFVDCGLTFDGRTGFRGTATDHTSTTMTVTGGTNWDETETLTITSSVPFFAFPGTTDVGDQIVFEAKDGSLYRLTIQGVTSATVATAIPNRALPPTYHGSAKVGWFVARNTVGGLGHLEGKTVSVLADGSKQSQKVVTGGTITLSPPAFIAHVGLPYTQDLETLEVLDNSQGVSIGKRKSIPSASVMVEETGAIWAGRDYDHLEERKSDNPTIYDAAPKTSTGTVKCSFSTTWSVNGSFVIRNTDPTPVTILGLIPDMVVGN